MLGCSDASIQPVILSRELMISEAKSVHGSIWFSAKILAIMLFICTLVILRVSSSGSLGLIS